MKTKILLADDNVIMSEGLRLLIEQNGPFEVVDVAHSGREAVKKATRLCPELVIMDVTMSDLNGIEATRQIKINNQLIDIIGLSIHSDSRFVVEMLKAGAKGYVLKQCAFEELFRAINAVLDGHSYLSAGVTQSVLEDLMTRGGGNTETVFTRLTHREVEVLQFLADGNSTKEVSSLLNVSVKTIDTHRSNIMRKLGISNTAELVKFAIREGLTTI